MSKLLMSGNEAIARGAYEAGCKVAAAYPGTPSTEILENIGKNYKDSIFCHWACNEKVAAEIVSGAAIGGARSLCAMKHVGMNVATDPIFTMAYAGVNGGLVFVTADDPQCHSSQNEQDNRLYAPHAKLAMIESSDSQECKEFTKAAFALSEQFDTPVLLRVTTRICHSKSIVETAAPEVVTVKKYERRPEKFAMLPATARKRHAIREQLLAELEDYAYDCSFNRIEDAPAKIGVITSGVSYQYVKEVFGDTVGILKMGLTYPLSRKLIAEFAQKYEQIYVVEENEPYLENAVKALGISCRGKDILSVCGELNSQIVKAALTGTQIEAAYHSEAEMPPRAPALCAGCPHRGFFYIVHKNEKRIVPVGDIGCYALGINAPLNGFDYSICMGSGFSSLIGLAKALEMQGDTRKALGMVGDSTFFHSGMASLIDIMTSQANVIACILDNSITAMTGHQDNPGTGRNLMGDPCPSVDIAAVVRAIGFEEDRMRIVDPLDLFAMQEAMEAGINTSGPFVIITKRPCALIKEVIKQNAGRSCAVDLQKCVGCKNCMKITCPALSFKDGKAEIDAAVCNGCGLCAQLCRKDAIKKVGVQ